MKKKDILFGILMISGLGLVITGAVVPVLLPIFVPLGGTLITAGLGMMQTKTKVCEDSENIVKSENRDSVKREKSENRDSYEVKSENVGLDGMLNAFQNPQVDEITGIFYHFEYRDEEVEDRSSIEFKVAPKRTH